MRPVYHCQFFSYCYCHPIHHCFRANDIRKKIGKTRKYTARLSKLQSKPLWVISNFRVIWNLAINSQIFTITMLDVSVFSQMVHSFAYRHQINISRNRRNWKELHTIIIDRKMSAWECISIWRQYTDTIPILRSLYNDFHGLVSC